jgi:hypothetical protein
MGRWPLRARTVAALSTLVLGCATYSQDLERARLHYQTNDFPGSLAILRVLGEDLDALSPTERRQYAYLRGMTDLRLSATSPSTSEADRAALRACARDWLDLSVREARTEGLSLSPDQLARAHASLAELVDVEAPRGACLEP